MRKMERQLSSSSTPSFSSYSSETLAQIAARVIHELSTDSQNSLSLDDNRDWEQLNHNDNDNDDDFEFAFVSGDTNSSPVSADDIFYNGQIRPTYPLFDRNLLDGVVCLSSIPATDTETQARPRRLSLRKLMFEEEREAGGSSCSSSDDGNELNGVAPEMYCVWTPPAKKKSNSMGSSSSKRWKLRDLLLLRSSSDGKKERLLFLGPTMHNSAAKDKDRTKRKPFLQIFSNASLQSF